MARKKYLDDRNDEGGHNQYQKGQKHVNTLQMHQGQGGGTKTRKSQDQSKYNDDSFLGVQKQLTALGLTIREMPGDGNCLFRALSDQLCGNSRNHLDYRRAVVQYMRDFRSDFEPFVEDDVPFDKYVHNLSQPGTFAGNDAIVAFARLQNVTVVIHQLNSPAWLIHPSKDQNQCSGREVHIAYHNGDHYNSVRTMGDDSENPTNIKLLAQGASSGKSPYKSTGKSVPSPNKSRSESLTANSKCTSTSVFESYDSCVAYGSRDEDYWVKDSADVDRLVEDVMSQTDYPDPVFVRDTLLDFNFDMAATVDFILSTSFVMSQQHGEKPDTAASNIDNSSLSNDQSTNASGEVSSNQTKVFAVKKQVTDMDEQCEDVDESEESTSSKTADDSDDNPSSPPADTESSQKPSCSRKEVRVNARKKKELKKREKKREAELRKKRNANSEGENVVVVSNFGSLDI
ncbi:OTU domain-containing protein 3 [Orchesella cincta]|uniref:OTU domain-containing protein 3 n=1 Tax=Orchesella cincta TaxID=48709 RepID=A0A1D2NAX8_ORCCI|nr:OTU domain-containing protein 3 [Orchesella cincta]